MKLHFKTFVFGLFLAIAPIASAPDVFAQEQPAVAGSEISFAVEVETVDAVNSSMSADRIKALIGGALAENAEAIASLNADRITIPAITLTYKIPTIEDGKNGTVTAVYENVVVDRVVSGVAGSVTTGRITVTQPGEGDFSFTDMSATNVDFAAMLAFYGLVGQPAGEDWHVLYDDARIGGGAFSGPDAECTLGAIEIGEVRVRPMGRSLLDFIALAQKLDSKPDIDTTPEEKAEVFGFLADLTGSIETSPMTMNGMRCENVGDPAENITIEVGAITIGAWGGFRYPEVSVRDVLIQGDAGTVSSGMLQLKEIDFSSTMETLKEAADAGEIDNDDWFEQNGRRLVPEISGVALESFVFDVENREIPGERIKGGIAAFDLSLGKYRNAIPTELSSRLSHFVVVVPDNSEDENMARLREAGIEELDLGYDVTARWNESGNTIIVENISVEGANLGSAAMALVLGNATPALFANDPQVVEAAGRAMTLKSVAIDLVNEGFLKIAYQQAAEEQGTAPETVPIMMSGMAQGIVLSVLGANPKAVDLAQALATFLNNGKSFAAKITANDEKGIGFAEFEAMEEDPAAFANSVEIEASAQ